VFAADSSGFAIAGNLGHLRADQHRRRYVHPEATAASGLLPFTGQSCEQ
jgi:hypothetical protein